MYITEPSGKKRPAVELVCIHCKQKFLTQTRFQNEAKYCSRRCMGLAKSQERRVTLVCATCARTFTRARSKTAKTLNGVVFCSRNCKDTAQRIHSGVSANRPPHYQDGLYAYRKRALEYYGEVCANCGYNENSVMLDVHHRDSNRKHNKVENLEVLCVWCHALVTRKVEQGSIPLASTRFRRSSSVIERRSCKARVGGLNPLCGSI